MSTAISTAGLARELASLCGPEHVRTDEASLAARAIDKIEPQAIVAPGTAEEIAGVLRFAAAHDLVVVPAGGLTRQHIGRIPPRIDIVLETTRLNAINFYEPGDLTIGVQAGAKIADVLQAVESNGQMLPFDAPSAAHGTIGGAVASAASGPLRHGYGNIRDFCLGVQFATAQGKVAKAGGRVVKNVAGYDVTKLMVGSYGTLAVITSANFRVFPQSSQTRTFAAEFAHVEQALDFRDEILLRSPLTPMALELVSPEAGAHVPSNLSHESWTVLVRAAGSDAVLARYRTELGSCITWQADGSDEPQLWTAVADLPDTLFVREPRSLVMRVVAPLQTIRAALQAALGRGTEHSFRVAIAGRAASPLYLAFTPTAPTNARYLAIVNAVRNVVGRDGVAAITHCPTDVKPMLDIWGQSATDSEAMLVAKHTLDPKNILNRGRFLL